MNKSIIYKLRKYNNLTRKELSELTKITDYRLRQLELSTRNITAEEVTELSEVFQYSINDSINLFNILKAFNKKNISEADKKLLQDARKIINDLLD